MHGIYFGLVAALSFGTSDFVARHIALQISAKATLVFSMGIGAALVTVYMLAGDGLPAFSITEISWLAVVSLANLVGMLALFVALTHGPVSVAAPTVSSYPVVVVGIALILGVRPEPLVWLGMGLTIIGVILLSRWSVAPEQDAKFNAAHVRKTFVFALLAALALGLQISGGQYIAGVVGTIPALWATRVGTCALALLVCLGTRTAIPLRHGLWPIIGLQALLDTAGMWAIYAPATNLDRVLTAVVATTFALVTVVLAKVFLKEAIARKQWLAIAIIAIGVAVLTGANEMG